MTLGAPAAAPARPRLWPFAALSAGYFAHVGFFNPYLPLWLQSLGYGVGAIGLLTALQSVTRLFAPYAWAWLGDRTGAPVQWLRVCALVALLFSLGLWWQPAPWWLPLVLLGLFLHTAGMLPLSETVLAHAVSRDGVLDAGRYGRVRLWGSLGFLVTVLLAGAWFERHGMASFPAWSNVTLVLALAAAWCVLPWREGQHAQSGHASAIWPVLRQRAVRWFLLAIFAHVMAHVILYIYFSLYLDQLGYSKHTIGLLWAIGVVLEVGWFFVQGRWLSRLRLAAWLVLAGWLTVMRMAAVAWGGAWLPVLLLAQASHAITFAAHHSVCIAWVSRHFPGALRARGQALYGSVAYGLGGVAAGLLGSAVSSRWGLAAVFVLAAAAALLGTAAAWRLRALGD
jgi:PPP family 3-phenylpropionic acid transporter